MFKKITYSAISALLLLQFSGCGSNSSSTQEVTPNDTASDGIGSVKVMLTDDPALYEAVYVTVDEVRVHMQGDCTTTDANQSNECEGNNTQWYTIASPHQTINLLSLQNGVTTELGEANISVGTYTQLRLILGDQEDNGTNILGTSHPYANYLILSGDDITELKVPSNTLHQNYVFDVNETGVYEMLIDFDANQSVHQAGQSGQWILTPVLGVSGRHQNSVSNQTQSSISSSEASSSAMVDVAVSSSSEGLSSSESLSSSEGVSSESSESVL